MKKTLAALLAFALAPWLFARAASAADEAALDAVSFTDSKNEVWLMRGDGSGKRRIAGKIGAYALSPDATSLAFPSLDPKDVNKVVLKDIASGAEKDFLRTKAGVYSVFWSPDGGKIACKIKPPPGAPTYATPIFIFDRNGAQIGQIPGQSLWGVGFAGDGASLVAQDMESLLVFKLDGSLLSKTPLTAFTGQPKVKFSSSDVYAPSPVDPDIFVCTKAVPGTKAFFKATEEDNSALFLHDRRKDPAADVRLTPENLLAMDPVWSLDGKRIYFSGYPDTRAGTAYPFAVYRVGRDGSGLTEIAPGAGSLVGRTSPVKQETK